MAAHLQDDGYHEIQLNGKQLVFLFMAATVVSVVFFLCGVLVGRGVRSERIASADTATMSAAAEPTPQAAPVPTPPPSGSDPRTAEAPPAPTDELSYFDRLEKKNAAPEDLKAAPAHAPVAVAPPAPAPVPVAKKETPAAAAHAPVAPKDPPPASASTPAPTPTPAATSAASVAPAAASAPSGPGFAVQIAALNVRTEADAIAKRLTSKGYAAYVVSPAAGSPSVYRVRVGKFPTRREAESVATRLEKEEQFKPWITR